MERRQLLSLDGAAKLAKGSAEDFAGRFSALFAAAAAVAGDLRSRVLPAPAPEAPPQPPPPVVTPRYVMPPDERPSTASAAAAAASAAANAARPGSPDRTPAASGRSASSQAAAPAATPERVPASRDEFSQPPQPAVAEAGRRVRSPLLDTPVLDSEFEEAAAGDEAAEAPLGASEVAAEIVDEPPLRRRRQVKPISVAGARAWRGHPCSFETSFDSACLVPIFAGHGCQVLLQSPSHEAWIWRHFLRQPRQQAA